MTKKSGYMVSKAIYGGVKCDIYYTPVIVFQSKEEAQNFVSTQDERDSWKIETIDVEGF